MNSKYRKASDPQRVSPSLSENINLKRSVALSNLIISAPTWNEEF